MALNHSLPLDPIDVRPLGEQLGQAVTSSLIKTPNLTRRPFRDVLQVCRLPVMMALPEVILPF